MNKNTGTEGQNDQTPSAWIFQGNPKYYDIAGAITGLDVIVWAVNQHKKQIKKDDKAYIWVSGSGGGIIASGTILCDPKMANPKPDDQYNNSGSTLKSEPFLAVDIHITRKFINETITRDVLQTDDRTKSLEILFHPNGTNFRVTKTEEAAIESIINGNLGHVPATAAQEDTIGRKRHYWLYAPGRKAIFWDSFYEDGIMGIGWDDIGDLTQYESKAAVKADLKQKYWEDKSYTNAGLALWQFANVMDIGDVVFAKQGMSTIVGRGVVESDYIFDDSRREYKHIRKVRWTDKGEWKLSGQVAMKTLTNITSDSELIDKLEEFAPGGSDPIDVVVVPVIPYPNYTEADFLNDVYMSAECYATLKGLLLRKKNVILQGAPGVGKTFAAKRLAYSIMGEKDTSRVKIVQFHQSYSYEDFVMGYRPNENGGFTRAEGPFYKFCKTAEDDDERQYFFIIDEINRGNLSRIFGELLMLIEGDKRGENNALRLLYKDEEFHVPQNLYIIGMANTADRSLAMIDYALRRRFAFFDMEPAFQSEGFIAHQNKIKNTKYDALVATVESLNKAIEEDPSLGSGFRVGHSYFCADDDNVDDAWISSVIEYELVPLLKEYWFDEPTKVKNWTAKLRGVLNG